jgi:protein required for attachment to host cells
MKKVTTGTWVLIADGEKALFLRNDGDEIDFNLTVVSMKEQENPSTREQGTDKPGRFQDDGVQQRSSLDDTDWHRLEKDRFADDLADLLYQRAHRGLYDRIILVASPKVLGELRHKLHKEVESRVLAELPKTLTTVPLDEVEKELQEEFGSPRKSRAPYQTGL